MMQQGQLEIAQVHVGDFNKAHSGLTYLYDVMLHFMGCWLQNGVALKQETV